MAHPRAYRGVHGSTPEHGGARAARSLAAVVVTACGALGAGCVGARSATPGDFEHPLPLTAPSASALSLPDGADPLALEDALRAAIRPPSLCFAQPALCGAELPAQSLMALRPPEAHLDALQTALTANLAVWPRASVVLHCETLCAWRPTAGRACSHALMDAGLQDPTHTLDLLRLLDALGPHGNSVAMRALAHPDVAVRREVAAWMSRTAADDALVVPLMKALDAEPDAQAAASVVRALGLLRDSRTVPFLEALVHRTPQPSVRAEVITALTWMGNPSYRVRFLQRLQPGSAVEKAALAQALEVLRANADHPEVVPADLSGAFGFWALPPPNAVGGVAFVAAFERKHARPLRWASGERLSREDLVDLLARLKDAGGVGLGAVRSTLARSCMDVDLDALLDIRRAIHVAGLPNHDAEAQDLTEVIQVVRTHHRAGRATTYWTREVRAAGDPLRIMP